MNRPPPRDALEDALDGVVGLRSDSSYELPLPPVGPERSWLLTGQGVADSRRVRGSNTDIRELLVGEGQAARDQGSWGDFSSAMERRAISEALTSLPYELRETVRLAYFEGMTNRGVADSLGMSVGQVRARLRQALGELQARIHRVGASLISAGLAIAAPWTDRIGRGRSVPARDLVAAVVGTAAAAGAAALILSPSVALPWAPSTSLPPAARSAPARVAAPAATAPAVTTQGVGDAAGVKQAPGLLPTPLQVSGVPLPAPAPSVLAPVFDPVQAAANGVITQVSSKVSPLPSALPSPPVKLP